MKKQFSLVLMLAAALAAAPVVADDATTAAPATTQTQQTGSQYYEEFCDILRLAETLIQMQNELGDNPSEEAELRFLAEWSKKAVSKAGQQRMLFDSPQLLDFISDEESESNGKQAGIDTKLEAMAADGRPNLWTLLAGLTTQNPDIPEEEREQRILNYIQRAALGGSASGMVSLAGTYLKNDTQGLSDNDIPDWCSKAIIAHNLNLTERSDNFVVRQALRIVTLDYLLRGKGSAVLATAAMYLELALLEKSRDLAETGYLLGESLLRLSEGDLKNRHEDCLEAYLVGAKAGHPAAMHAVAEILSHHPAYSEEEIANLRHQAEMAGYNPFINYLKEIKTRAISLNFYFTKEYLYLLERDEIENLHTWAKKLLPHCPDLQPGRHIHNIRGFISKLADAEVIEEYMQAAEKPVAELPKVKAPEQKLEATVEPGEIGLLILVRNSVRDKGTAMALDAILQAYEDEEPQYKAITRVLRLANLHRALRENDAYGFSAALNMLSIERELGGAPGCTESQRNDLLRVFSGIYRSYLRKNAIPAAE